MSLGHEPLTPPLQTPHSQCQETGPDCCPRALSPHPTLAGATVFSPGQGMEGASRAHRSGKAWGEPRDVAKNPSLGGSRPCSLEKPLLNSADLAFLGIRNGLAAPAQPCVVCSPLQLLDLWLLGPDACPEVGEWKKSAYTSSLGTCGESCKGTEWDFGL